MLKIGIQNPTSEIEIRIEIITIKSGGEKKERKEKKKNGYPLGKSYFNLMLWP